MTKLGDLLTGDEVLADGVRGYSIDAKEGLYIPVISAEKEGDGRVGAFLNDLPRDRRVVFPTVLSSRLAGMLQRRGFHPTQEWVPEYEEWVEVWERMPCPD